MPKQKDDATLNSPADLDKKEAKENDARMSHLVSRHKVNKINRVPLMKAKRFEAENLDPEYHYYYANDEGDNIAKFLRAGYVPVENTEITGTGRVDAAWAAPLGKFKVLKNVNPGVDAYLLKVKKELWQEDEDLRQSKIDEMEDQIRNSGKSTLSVHNKRGTVEIRHKTEPGEG